MQIYLTPPARSLYTPIMLKKIGSQITARRVRLWLSSKQVAALAGDTLTTLTTMEATGRATSGKLALVLPVLGLELRAVRVRKAVVG